MKISLPKLTSLLLFLLVFHCLPAQHFQPVWNTPFSPMNIYVIKAQLNELDLQAGDEIGVFDVDQANNEYCVGAVVLSQPVSPDNYALIICSMDDGTNPDNPNGFNPGNEFIFKFWASEVEIDEVEITFPYLEYDEVFTALGTAAVELSASANNCLLSINPDQYDFGDVITRECSGTESFTITNSGSSSAIVSISLGGNHVNQFVLNSSGTYSIPSGGTKTVTVDFCPSSLGDKSATLVINGSGSCNNLSVMLTGVSISSTQHFQPVWNTPFNPMNIYVTEALLNDLDLQAGDEIGIFDVDQANNEFCVGAVVLSQPVSPDNYALIICSMDDGANPDNPNGFTPGNPFIFRYYAGSSEIEDVEYTFPYPGNDEVFKALGTGVVELSASSGSCTLSVNPDQHDFGEVISGECSEEKTFTITNSGSSTVTGQISITGTNENEFNSPDEGYFSISSGNNKIITVEFCPISDGVKSAFLSIDGYSSCNDIEAKLTGLGSLSQSINLPAGWSGISSYLQPFETNIEDVLIDVSEQIEMICNLDSYYQPGEGAGDLNSWNYKSGYFIKVSEGVILTLKGINPENKTVNLISGWNLMPVLSDENVPIEGLFENQINNVEILKEAAGTNVWWPELNIFMIEELIPGKSYLVKVNQDMNITFQESYGFSCGEKLFDTRDGQEYETVQIGNQCWMAENLNYDTGNCWCYKNDPTYCNIYGYLYNWQTAILACPAGWHLPSDEEWKILEGFTDSQYPLEDPEWDNTGRRGFDAGKNLKSNSGWLGNGNGTDLFGFGALPGCHRSTNGGFYYQIGYSGSWWTSSENLNIYAWYRILEDDSDGSLRTFNSKSFGFSIRCLKD